MLMYLYNTTFKVDLNYSKHFLDFIQQEIKPNLISLNGVQQVYFLELLNVDVIDGNTFCLQINFENMQYYNQYLIENEHKLLQQIFEQYEDKVLFFSSLLKTID